MPGRWAGFAQYFVVGYTATSAAAAPAETPEPDSFGVVVAESWKDIYPNEYQTYLANESNTPQGKEDYLAEYPEFETIYGGAQSSMAKQGYTCADGPPASIIQDDDGTEYHSHNLVNPTEDPAIMENSEGAHNPSLAQENLDKCEDELKAGYILLNMTY